MYREAYLVADAALSIRYRRRVRRGDGRQPPEDTAWQILHTTSPNVWNLRRVCTCAPVHCEQAVRLS
jgi:hypothetical protein